MLSEDEEVCDLLTISYLLIKKFTPRIGRLKSERNKKKKINYYQIERRVEMPPP